MNRRLRKVISMLKPKVKAFGFNRKEIEGIAARIADNLSSKEDASEEEVNEEIENAIDAVIPYLEFGQSFANRVINDHKNGNEGEDDDDEEAAGQSRRTSSQSRSSRQKGEKSDDSDAMQAVLDELKGLRSEISAIKGEKVTDSRRSKLEALLKDAGTFGTRTLK